MRTVMSDDPSAICSKCKRLPPSMCGGAADGCPMQDVGVIFRAANAGEIARDDERPAHQPSRLALVPGSSRRYEGARIVNASPDLNRAHLRRAYNAWRAGAGLTEEGIERLAAAAGLEISRNRMRNLGRHSDRGVSITEEELAVIISAWVEEQQAARRVGRDEGVAS